MQAVTPKECLDSLFSVLCPFCAQGKFAKRTACGRCYYKLSPATRLALRARIGEGDAYEKAIEQAMKELKVGSLIIPGPGMFRPPDPVIKRRRV